MITFTEKNLRKVLGKRQYKTSLGKLRDLHEKYAAERKLEDRQAFDYAINVGVGAMWLNLPFGHYMKLMEDQ